MNNGTENSTYLSIADFSKLAETSQQNIYQRLETSLKPYARLVKGKKYIDIRALELFGIENVEQVIQENVNNSINNNSSKDLNTLVKEYHDRELDKALNDLKECKHTIELLQAEKSHLTSEKEALKMQVEELKAEKGKLLELIENEQKLNAQRMIEQRSKSLWQRILNR